MKQISKKDILTLMHQLDKLLQERQKDKYKCEEITQAG